MQSAELAEGVEMKIALLSPVAKSVSPQAFSHREKYIWLLAEGLVARGLDVTLFAAGDSITKAKLEAVIDRSFEEDSPLDVRVAEYFYLGHFIERADDFDLIHNNLDIPAIIFSEIIRTPLLTTIHCLPSRDFLSVYQKYNQKTFYVALSQANRLPGLDYLATVYPGINLNEFTFNEKPDDYLLFSGPIHPEAGTWEAIEIARKVKMKLIIAGKIKNKDYFEKKIFPEIDDDLIKYVSQPDQFETKKLLASAYALLYPLKYEEAFSYAVVEAMACGTPVIAFKKGAIPEIVNDGRTGFVVNNIEEAVIRVKEIGELSRLNCRQEVEDKFSLERMVDDYLKVYQQVAEGTLGKGQRGFRPWGRYIVLEEREKHKVKRIEVKEGMRLSYQRHRRRSEHWFILEGKALVTIDGQERLLSPGEAIDIPAAALHRIEAKEGTVVFIEVQRGDYLGEDDVERVNDDFGRL